MLLYSPICSFYVIALISKFVGSTHSWYCEFRADDGLIIRAFLVGPLKSSKKKHCCFHTVSLYSIWSEISADILMGLCDALHYINLKDNVMFD